MRFTTRQITQSAFIAAAYLVLTFVFSPISFGMIQFRISEALMLLAAITPVAIPGLFVGCLLANIIGGFGPVDIILGSMATLVAALLTWLLSKSFPDKLNKIKLLLLPLPTILINGIIVGGYLPFIIPEIRNMSDNFLVVLLISVGSVMTGEAVVTYALGLPVYFGIKRTKIFRSEEWL